MNLKKGKINIKLNYRTALTFFICIPRYYLCLDEVSVTLSIPVDP